LEYEQYKGIRSRIVEQNVQARKKMYTGQVVSDKMDKTIVIKITTKKLHRLYKKYVSHSKKIKAHDEKNEAHIGDTVRVIESKPYSKEKCWKLIEIVERAK
jgi:small subunit ribosomal protein S17